MIDDLPEEVPVAFSKTLADFGIDVRGKAVLEVGSGGGHQAAWLAMLGAESVDAVDPIYTTCGGDDRKAILNSFPTEALQRVNFLPFHIENYVSAGKKYPVVLVFQAFTGNWESYANSIAKSTMDDGIALIMTDQMGINYMPKNVLEKYFSNVQPHKCGEGRYLEDEFFLEDLNRFAFVCRGPKRSLEQTTHRDRKSNPSSSWSLPG